MGRCEWDERQVEWRIDCRKSVRDGEKNSGEGRRVQERMELSAGSKLRCVSEPFIYSGRSRGQP